MIPYKHTAKNPEYQVFFIRGNSLALWKRKQNAMKDTIVIGWNENDEIVYLECFHKRRITEGFDAPEFDAAWNSVKKCHGFYVGDTKRLIAALQIHKP